jgi:hypothetical protein
MIIKKLSANTFGKNECIILILISTPDLCFSHSIGYFSVNSLQDDCPFILGGSFELTFACFLYIRALITILNIC